MAKTVFIAVDKFDELLFEFEDAVWCSKSTANDIPFFDERQRKAAKKRAEDAKVALRLELNTQIKLAVDEKLSELGSMKLNDCLDEIHKAYNRVHKRKSRAELNK